MCEKQNKPEDIKCLKEYPEYKDRLNTLKTEEKQKSRSQTAQHHWKWCESLLFQINN